VFTFRSNIALQRLTVAVSVLLLAAKFLAFFLTKSNAIFSDALESIVNVVAGFIGLYSIWLSGKPRDEDHPYGHGKVEFISASIEGAMIFFAGLVLFGRAVYSFFIPHSIEQLDTGIYIMVATAAVNYAFGVLNINQGRKNSSAALVASGEHLRSDAYTTVGILIALLLIRITNFIWLDNVVIAVFASVLIFISYRVLRRAVAGIMDEADNELLEKIVSHLDDKRLPAWVDLHNIRVIKYGPVLHIDCHLTVPWYYNVNEAHAEVEAVAYEVKSTFNNPMEFFIHTDPCLPPQSCSICILKECGVRQAPFERRVEWNLKSTMRDEKHGINN
jgi:cation diffusion facilitator family transporter